MKSTEEFLSILKKYKIKVQRQYGIVRIGIFGSVARNTQHEASDVDICLETTIPNMFDLVHIKEDLQVLFDRKVDIVRMREGMDVLLKNRIEKEGIYV